ncbi:hypothetical protein ABPG75_012805 [Micractinium tetrahymenae]
MDDIPQDPDRFALAIVQQWLADQGYTQALTALEREAGLRVRHEVQRGSQLLQLVYDHMEAAAAAALDEAAAERRALEERLLAGGSASGPRACPSRLRAAFEGAHPANITALACWPGARQFATGSADGAVRLLDYGGTLLRTLQAGTSGVLCLAAHPAGGLSSGGSSATGSIGGGEAPGLLAAGCMDGSVAVLDVPSGGSTAGGGSTQGVLARVSPHRKYVVAAAWDPSGTHLVTASWDNSFAVHRLQRSSTGQQAGSGSEAEGPGGGWELAAVYTGHTTGRVNAVQFLPPLANSSSSHGSSSEAPGGGRGSGDAGGSSSSDGTFLVAVQGSNYLREFCIPPGTPGSSSSSTGASSVAGSTQDQAAAAGPAGTPAAAAGGAAAVQEVRRINLNGPGGDDHVSFSAAHLALSPCGRLLLVSADNGRLVVYERLGWTQVRSIIGLPTEQFHQFAAAWHSSGHYIMAAAAHGGLCIFHLGSAKRVATVAAHAKNLRALAYDARNNLLLTCSFDRTVKMWEAAEAEGQAAEQAA